MPDPKATHKEQSEETDNLKNKPAPAQPETKSTETTSKT